MFRPMELTIGSAGSTDQPAFLQGCWAVLGVVHIATMFEVFANLFCRDLELIIIRQWVPQILL